jgi:hypothetical protein
MRPDLLKDIIRPIYGTIVFQPFAVAWCLLNGDDYMTTIGPFVLYSMFAFIPIYAIYEKLWNRSWTQIV